MLAIIPLTATHARTVRVLQPETLTYKVMFKWGLINKKAGHATLTLTHDKHGYISQMAAASEPWADKIFRVRDTLNSRMATHDMTPLFYEKIAHEGNESKHDVVRYDYSTPGVVKADCTRRKVKKGELKVNESRSMEAEGAAVDMLSSFYFMRSLPFESIQPGHVEKIDIFSGKRKEILSIRYCGIDDIEIDDVKYPAYHVKFTFTSKGGAKTSDDMDAWISANADRIPLRMEGKLPVGKVHCLYTGQL